MVDNNNGAENNGEDTFEEKVVNYIKSLAAIEEAMEPFKEQKASTQGQLCRKRLVDQGGHQHGCEGVSSCQGQYGPRTTDGLLQYCKNYQTIRGEP